MPKGKYVDWITDEGLALITGWARDGLTDEQIAHNIGITAKTLYEWKKKYGEISEALKKGKQVVDYQVENALLKSALGYKYKEQVMSASGKVEEVEKYQSPSTTAQIFWLKNRKPDKWRDKQQVEHSGKINDPTAELSSEELRKLIALHDG